ncbi:hypothetical protein [Cognatishimia sp. F0-27]|uniref:beta strand repeat-containing protein n=1 Tax=Cognatishimia sp. F0-27 TaxID=2816855 RepID=UPI001D0CBEA0|nr:hypothetical protein [Cognatishimia sp. F0-27]MCC1494649.1 hypothetical protein [Cognatishimia sp. F0-27]
MTFLKLAGSSVSALALTVGAAMANDNEAFIDTDGSNNTALITQSGDDNNAGADVGGVRILQQGDGNNLDILQSGDDNQAGASTTAVAGSGAQGIDQIGAGNALDIEQSSDWNHINVVTQTDGNSATILQEATDRAGAYRGNVIAVIEQTNTGGSDNTITVTQTAVSPGRLDGGTNVIGDARPAFRLRASQYNANKAALDEGGIFQDGTGNAVTVDQDGNANLVRLIDQIGADNDATAIQNGDRNLVNAIAQVGAGNDADVEIVGDLNGWSGLSAGGPADANELGLTGAIVAQFGDGNDADVVINGNGNNYVIDQFGNDNTALIDIMGGIPVIGENEIAIVQDFDGNTAQTFVNGSGNSALTDQIGMGNTATLTIDGIANGGWSGGIFGSIRDLTGDAGTAAALSVYDLSGTILQDGEDNSTTLTITGDFNAFATDQLGLNNMIMGVTLGNGNQAAVVQTGNGNIGDYAQIGNGNNAGIIQ